MYNCYLTKDNPAMAHALQTYGVFMTDKNLKENF